MTQALARHRPSSARRLVLHPILWATTAALGASAAMIAGAPALAALVGVMGLSCAAAGARPVRRRIERAARRASDRARRDDRESRLEEASVRKQGLAAATQLVDRIAATDPALAARLELEALLDRYVELELAAVRYEGLLARGRRVLAVPEGLEDPAQIRERSAALLRTWEARLAEVRDELASIVELLQLVIEHCALEVDLQGDPVGARVSMVLAATPRRRRSG